MWPVGLVQAGLPTLNPTQGSIGPKPQTWPFVVWPGVGYMGPEVKPVQKYATNMEKTPVPSNMREIVLFSTRCSPKMGNNLIQAGRSEFKLDRVVVAFMTQGV